MDAQDTGAGFWGVVLQGDDKLYLLLVQGSQENPLLPVSQGAPKREGKRTPLV